MAHDRAQAAAVEVHRHEVGSEPRLLVGLLREREDQSLSGRTQRGRRGSALRRQVDYAPERARSVVEREEPRGIREDEGRLRSDAQRRRRRRRRRLAGDEGRRRDQPN